MQTSQPDGDQPTTAITTPPTLRTFRAVSIDDARCRVRDDALSIRRSPTGWRILACIADMPHIAPDYRAWKRRLEARGAYGLHQGQSQPAAAVVLDVSLGGECRVVGIQRAQAILDAVYDPATYQKAVDQCRAPQGMEMLADVDRALQQRENRGYSSDIGGVMTALSAALAHFLTERGVPLVYIVKDRFDADASFSTVPGVNLRMGREIYARFTSPLWRMDDMANLANMLAFADGYPPPFGPAELEAWVRLLSHEGRDTLDVGAATLFSNDAPRRVPSGAREGDVRLRASSPTAFRTMMQSLKVQGPALQAEFLHRLGAGTLERQDAAMALVHPAGFLCPQAAARTLVALLGPALGDPVQEEEALRPLFKASPTPLVLANACARAVGLPAVEVVMQSTPCGQKWQVAASCGHLQATAQANRKAAAILDACTTLVLDMADMADMALAEQGPEDVLRPQGQVARAMVRQEFSRAGLKLLPVHYEKPGSRHQAILAIKDRPERFRGTGRTQAQAREAAAEVAIEWLEAGGADRIRQQQQSAPSAMHDAPEPVTPGMR